MHLELLAGININIHIQVTYYLLLVIKLHYSIVTLLQLCGHNSNIGCMIFSSEFSELY